MFTPPVLEADPDGTPQWLATDYVPAPSLHEVVWRYGVMPAPALTALGAGLAEALTAIHKAGIAHLDLKPGNVLIASDGPRVIDFGIARAFGADESPRTGGVVGTPGYMAPEQLSFDGETGPPTDVFALGCVLTFAATGGHPFGSGELDEILRRTKDDAPRLDGVPDRIRPLVASCLDKEPGRRPSVERVLNSLLPADPAALVPPALRADLAWRRQDALTLLRRPPKTPGRNVSRRRFLAASAATGTALGAAAAGGVRLLGHSPQAAAPVTAGAAPVPLWRSAIPQTGYTSISRLSVGQAGDNLVVWNPATALAFNMATGSRPWTITAGPQVNDPALLGVFGGTLYAILATPGPSLLSYTSAGAMTGIRPLAQAFDALGVSASQATFTGLGAGDGVVVVAMFPITAPVQATAVAIDLADGHLLWHRPVSQGVQAFSAAMTGDLGPVLGGAVDEQNCYLQDATSTLAIELRSGTVRWSAQNTAAVAGGFPPQLTVDSGALILTSLTSLASPSGAFVGTANFALDTASGAQLWSNPALDALAVTTGNGRLYLLNGQHSVQALTSRTAEVIWQTPNPVPDAVGDAGDPFLSALSASPSLLTVPLWTSAPGMVVLSATDGRPLWAYQDPVATGSTWSVWAAAETVYGLSAAELYAFPASAT